MEFGLGYPLAPAVLLSCLRFGEGYTLHIPTIGTVYIFLFVHTHSQDLGFIINFVGETNAALVSWPLLMRPV